MAHLLDLLREAAGWCQQVSTDRHKSRPKAVRMPDGLPAWYEEHAKAMGRPVNAVLVQALEEFRARNDGATTAQSRPPVPHRGQ